MTTAIRGDYSHLKVGNKQAEVGSLRDKQTTSVFLEVLLNLDFGEHSVR